MNRTVHLLPVTAENVLDHVEKSVKESKDKQLSDENLLTLHSVFGVVLQRALDILEKYPLIEVYSTTDKTRSLIEVKGDNDRCYRIFPGINFCSCLAFKYLVLEKCTQITCKHLLAGRIATILEKTVHQNVTEEQYLMLIKSMFDI